MFGSPEETAIDYTTPVLLRKTGSAGLYLSEPQLFDILLSVDPADRFVDRGGRLRQKGCVDALYTRGIYHGAPITTETLSTALVLSSLVS